MSGPGEGVPSPKPDLPLSERHRTKLLEESGISPEDIRERGYFTASNPEQLRELGFAEYQLNVRPWSSRSTESTGWPASSTASVRIDPREDATKPSKFIKYEQPKGTGIVLDVPPRARPMLSDKSKRLWIVEGEKKADSLISRGECAVGAPGGLGLEEGRPSPPGLGRDPARRARSPRGLRLRRGAQA